jgi:hypothetical protein
MSPEEPTVPEEVRRLVGEREDARAARDFARADALRDRIRAAGFEVVDTPTGPSVAARAEEVDAQRGPYRRSVDVPSLLGEEPSVDVSVQWVVQGWPEDVRRGIEAFGRTGAGTSCAHVVVDATGASWPEGTDVVRFDPEAGWAAARNAGLRRSTGHVAVLVDGSIEPSGDALAPLSAALADPSVGVTGPFGIVTDHHLHHFHESDGPEVDAVEGYLMALRRELIVEGLRFDEKFRFYRSADIELSFQVKARGLRATVTELPVTRHEHRMWANTPEEQRERWSKRNYYRFLDRWRGRTDLLVDPDRPPGSEG